MEVHHLILGLFSEHILRSIRVSISKIPLIGPISSTTLCYCPLISLARSSSSLCIRRISNSEPVEKDLDQPLTAICLISLQRELFLNKFEPRSPSGERKLSAASTASMKTKWLKAFRSLKPASGSAANEK